MKASALKTRQDRRRADITAAAIDLVASSGIGAMKMATLADAVDLTPGALYRYFPSKDHVLAAIEIVVLDDYARVFDSITEATKDRRAIETLAALVDAYAQLEAQGSEHFRVLAHFIAPPDQVLPDDIAEDIVAPVTRLFSFLALAIDRAAASGQLSAGASLQRGACLWSALHGVLERRKLTRFAPGVFDIDAIYRETAATFARAWGASDTDVEALFAQVPADLRPTYAHVFGELRC